MNRVSLDDSLLASWRTNNRVTEFFFEHLPGPLWRMKIPGAPRRTVRMLAGHIHNSRCAWITMIGRHYGIKAPASVDRRRVTRTQLLRALKHSSEGVVRLLNAGLEDNGRLGARLPWNNIPADVVHVMTYLVVHEAHHRGQIVMAARTLGHRLPPSVTNGLWQWNQRSKEGSKKR